MANPCASQRTTKIFSGTKIKITNEGHRYLGGTAVKRNLKMPIRKKVMKWIKQLNVLSKIAAVEPHAAYCAFVSGFRHKVSYTIRTVPNIPRHLEKVDQAVDKKFIRTLTDGYFSNKMDRKLQ